MIPTVVKGADAALASIREAISSGAPFRLALFDAQMPYIDGFSLAQRSRQIAGFWAPILIMLPPTEVGHDASRCRELGIVDYCPKPVWESGLVKAMVKALQSSGEGNAPQTNSGSAQEVGRLLRILLAEGNEVSQVLVTHLLEKRGHRVTVAADGMAALAAIHDAKVHEFDLLMMDMEMPLLNGIETAKAIRKIERKNGGRLPIVATSTHPSPAEREACTAAGIDGYLAKPLRARELNDIIQRLVMTPTKTAPEALRMNSIFDKSSFLSRLEGDELLGNEIIEMFLRECPKLLDGVRQAAEQRNAHLLERAAHSLKGSVGDMVAPEAFAVARTLEQLAREGKIDEAQAALPTLEVAIQRLDAELRHLENRAA
jgi:CheY-like chemotaxis protein/HPt (histidine-containing phosphotransfer) domain-containing protein